MRGKRRRFWLALGPILLLILLGVTTFWWHPLGCFRVFNEARLRLAGVRSSWTIVRGYRLHYYALGPESGPPVVLVHGLGGRGEDWVNLAPYLTAAGYRVYLPDLPGYGQSDRPGGFSYSIRDQASVVLGFLDALSLRQVNLGGWSMGGWIVQRVAAAHPERIRRLLLFDSAGLHTRPQWDAGLFTPTTSSQLRELDGLLMPHPPEVPGFIADDILRASREHSWVIRRSLDSMLTGQDTTDEVLPRLQMPVAILWGREDRIIPLDQGEAMHRLIPHSRLETFPGCGHLAPNQCADRVGPRVVEFLRGSGTMEEGRSASPEGRATEGAPDRSERSLSFAH